MVTTKCNRKHGSVFLPALIVIVVLFGYIPAHATFMDNPLNTASGASIVSQADLSHGKIFSIDITRQYNSKSGYASPLGHGWAFSCDKQLYVYSDGSVVIRTGPGRKSKFMSSTEGGFTSPLSDTGTLTLNTDGMYTYTALDGTKELYDLNGRLASITDPRGASLVFTYESATKSPLMGLLAWNVDQTQPTVVAYVYHLSKIEEKNTTGSATGKWVSFSYDPTSGMLTGLADNLGRSITYGHDAIGNLTSVTGTGVAATYGYADPNNRHLPTSIDEGHGTYVNTYDTAGRVVQQVHGNTTISLAYTTPGVLTKLTTTIKDTSGRVISTETRTVAFDNQRQVINETDTLGNQIKYTRNGKTLITRKEWWINTGTIAAPNLVLDHAIDYTYDTQGNMLTEVAPNGTTTYTYDAAGNMLSVTNPLSQTTTYTYNSLNQVLTTVGPQGTVTNTYDPSGNLVTTTDPAGVTTRFGYDARGNLSTVTNAANQTTTHSYDANDNLASITDPTGAETSFTYDINGNLLTWTDPAHKVTTFSYDTLNRLIKVTDPRSQITSYTYDNNGNRSAVTDANGNSTTYTYNDQGQVATVKDALGNTTTLTYGGVTGTNCSSCGGSGGDNLVGLTDAKGQTTSFQYDFLNRITLEIDPLQKSTTYAYDPAGNLAARTNAGGSRLAYVYDPLRRLTGITYPDGSTVTYSYNTAGRLQSATNNNVTYTYGYDAGNRVTSVTDSRGYAISYQYDALGNRSQMIILPNTTDQRITNYTYDTGNRMQTITSAAGTFTYGYDTNGRRSSLAYPNQVNATYLYDDAGRLTTLTHAATGAAIAAFAYSLDNVGNRLSKTATEVEQYQYDAIYRLLSVTSGKPETFTYDSVGNRLTGPGIKDTSYLYNTGNQMTKGRQFSYTYDNNGNQVVRSIPAVTDKSWTFTWDFENRLTKMEKIKGTEKHTVTFKYDPLGRRIEKKADIVIGGITKTATYTYLYDGDNIALEILTDNSGTTKTVYTHGAGTDEHLALERNGSYLYYHADGLGNISAITGVGRNVVQTYEYDSFGMPKASTDFYDAYTYTGREWDRETGMYYYRARYYDPMEGRFISKDPIGFAGGDVNLYGYVQNNPINFIDPSGMFRFTFLGQTIDVKLSATFLGFNGQNDLQGLNKSNFSNSAVLAPLSAGIGVDISINSPPSDNYVSPFIGLGRNLSLGTNLVYNPTTYTYSKIQGINVSLGFSVGIPIGVSMPNVFSTKGCP